MLVRWDAQRRRRHVWRRHGHVGFTGARQSRAPPRAGKRSEAKRCEGLAAHAHALDAELAGELARAGGDAGAQLGGLEDDRLAALRERVALEPLVASDG